MTDRCKVPPPGWWCSRKAGHEGPCAARPNEDQLVELAAEAIYPHLPNYMTLASARIFARAAVSANSHDELLDALQRATKWLRLVVATEDDPRCEDDLEAAESALAHARGERT